MSKTDRKSKPLTGKKVLACFAGFFLVIFGVNIIMSYFAVSTFSGVETEDAYRKGRDYNSVLEIARAQRDLGWQLNVEVAPPVEGQVLIEARLQDDKGAPVGGKKLAALFFRPTHKGIDKSLSLIETVEANYVGMIELPAEGQWELRIEVLDEQETLFRQDQLYYHKRSG